MLHDNKLSCSTIMSNQLLKIQNFIAKSRLTPRALRELEKVDPRDRFVLICPDHVNARLGMGFHLLTCNQAEQVYQEASELLKMDILRLCLEGPKEDLLGCLTNRHIATYVTNHAAITKYAQQEPELVKFIKASGGIGVGFINSLVFDGALSFEDGLDLVKHRADAMSKASKLVPNSCIRVKVSPATRKIKLCRAAQEHCKNLGIAEELAVCSVSKQVSPHVIEIAGHQEAINYLENNKDLFKFRFCDRLAQPAYHTDMMNLAKDYMMYYLKHKRKESPHYLKEPSNCSVYSATSGKRLRSLKDIEKDISVYPTQPILIEQLFHTLYARPKTLAQPNTLVLWDKFMLKSLQLVNRKAWSRAKLIEA